MIQGTSTLTSLPITVGIVSNDVTLTVSPLSADVGTHNLYIQVLINGVVKL